MSTLFFFAEHQNGRVADAALEVAGAGRVLADKMGIALVAVHMGSETRSLIGTLGEHGADRVLICEDERLSGYAPEAAVQLLEVLVHQHAPAAVLFADTCASADLAVRLAARLGTGLAANVTALTYEARSLRVTRLAYTDKLQAVTGAQSIVLQRSVGEVKRAPRSPEVQEVALALPDDAVRVKLLRTIKADPRTVPLHQAEFIVSGGNGVRDFGLLWELADRMGASVGGSRVVCDDGRLPRERQIGESGTTVAPRCYLAFGISGASQHLRGMQDSLIIAVNTDRHAPLLKRANMAVVADAEAVMRAMLDFLDTGRFNA